MPKSLKWEFVLGDKMSRPAAGIVSALSGVSSALGQVAIAQDKTAKSSQSFIRDLDHLWNVAGRVMQPLKDAAGGIFDIGRSFLESGIHAARWKEDMQVSLETVLGSSARATEAMKGMLTLAQHLPMSTGQVFDIGKQFMLMGFQPGKGLNQLIAAASDVEGLRGPGAAGALVDIVRRFKSGAITGRLLHETLSQVGLSQEDFLGELQKTAGVSKDPKALIKQLEGGQIGLNDQLTAFLGAIAGKEGGVLGNLAEKQMGTLSGLLTNLQSRWEEFQMGFSNTGGFEKLKSAVGNVAGLLDPDSDLGKALSSNLANLFSGTLDSLVGGFAGPEGVGRINHIFEQISVGLVTVKDIAVTALDSIGAFVSGFTKGLDVSGDLFGKDGHLNPEAMKAVVSTFGDLGKSVGVLAEELGHVVGFVDKLTGAKAITVPVSIASAVAGGNPLGAAASAVSNSKWWDYTPTGYVLNRLSYLAKDNHAGGVGTTEVMANSDVKHLAGGGWAGTHGPELAVLGDGGEPELVVPQSRLRSGGGSGSSLPEVHLHMHVGEHADRQMISEAVAKLHTEGLSMVVDAWEIAAMQQGRLGPGNG
jgi:hypothetical protein